MAHPGDHAESDQPTRAEVLAHLARILDSREFCTARNRARFLEYVITQTLDGANDRLKEYTIGVEVFDRGAGFDPRTDGVVRTQAGLVRKHLERYYATEGRDDDLEIVVPKGHYVPQVQRRRRAAADEAGAAATSVAAAEAGADGSQSNGVGADAEVRSAASSQRARRGWRPRPLASIAAILAAAALLIAIVWIVRGGGTAPAAASAGATNVAADDGSSSPIWAAFVAPGASNVLAFGIPQFFSSGGLWIRDTAVNVSTTSFPAGGHLDAIGRSVGPLRPAEAYTGIGEAYGVYLLSRFFFGRARELRVVRSPSVSWDNVKHDNVIFLTSARFKTLADQLAYPSAFTHLVGTDAPNRVLNLQPAPGEQAEYVTKVNGPVSIDHAIVTLWPGKLPGRRVLVLSGGHTWGTQAAAEYVTEAGYLRELHAHLRACQQRTGQARHAEFFQVLLRVEIRDNQPLGVHYVTHRDLAISETGDTLHRAALAGSAR